MSDIQEADVTSMTQPNRAEPLVVQVSRQFREHIASGGWPVHSRLPGEKHLARELGVSRGTVREALSVRSAAELDTDVDAYVNADSRFHRAVVEGDRPTGGTR